MRLSFFRFLLILLFLGSGISACARCEKVYAVDANPHRKIVQRLKEQGVQVVQQGETLRMIFPVITFFDPQTTEVKEGQIDTLAAAAALINMYRTGRVYVNGYTNNVGTLGNQQTYSLRVAQAVASYLWNNGVALNRMQEKGYGNFQHIASNRTPQGAIDNQRVEVWVR